MATEMAMLNVRIERDLRERGNAVLADLGVTPSQYIRALWDRLALGDREAVKAEVAEVMTPARTPERQAEIDRKLAALKRIDQSFYDFAAKLGLYPSTHVAMNDEELEEERYQYFLEKYGE